MMQERRSGSLSARDMTPSQRAKAHAERIRQREQRRHEGAVPGPGTYDGQRARSSSTDLTASSAFRSQTPRQIKGDTMLRDLSLNTDAGAYDPSAQSTLAASAKRTFAKPALAGASQFGSLSARKMRQDILGESFGGHNTPDPGMHQGTHGVNLDVTRPRRNNNHAGHTFRSASNQRPRPPKDIEPPPGAYDPNDALTFPRPQNAGYSLASNTERFKATGYTHSTSGSGGSGPAVGPGCYEARHGTIAHYQRRLAKTSSRSKAAGFDAVQPARDLPFERSTKASAETPGPANYDVKSRIDQADGHASAFRSNSDRTRTMMAGFKSETGDPGAYDPSAQSTLAASAKRTFAKPALAGASQFGSLSARKMRQDILGESFGGHNTPDPGMHQGTHGVNLDVTRPRRNNNHAGHTFRSASNQRPRPPKDIEPPPGAYDPNDALTFPRPQNAGYSLASNTERFSSTMLFDRARSSSETVGPGSYNPRACAGGGRSTIAGSVAAQTKRGKNASFCSETVRDLTAKFFPSEVF